MKRIVLSICTLLAIVMAALPAEGAAQPMFGRMFPNLPAYDAPPDNALTALTCGQGPISDQCTLQTQVLPAPAAMMGPLFDPNISAPSDPNDDNPGNSGNPTPEARAIA